MLCTHFLFSKLCMIRIKSTFSSPNRFQSLFIAWNDNKLTNMLKSHSYANFASAVVNMSFPSTWCLCYFFFILLIRLWFVARLLHIYSAACNCHLQFPILFSLFNWISHLFSDELISYANCVQTFKNLGWANWRSDRKSEFECVHRNSE